MDKRKIIVISLCLLVIVIGNIFVIPHTLDIELIEEIKYLSLPIDSYNIKYFFLKDEDYPRFYDGNKILNYFLQKDDFSKIDTNKYTYIVSIDREIESVKYSGLKCKRRVFIFFPYEYQASIECGKTTNDGMLRIYRMKKINIDYDYHDDEFIN